MSSNEQHHGSKPPPRRSGERAKPPRQVDHTYRDFSHYPTDDLPSLSLAPTNFPTKLHHILSDPEYHHIISWMPHGRAWKVHNKDLLVSEVVPKYFGQSKYQSFARQLNGWGFKRLNQAGNDNNAYYHECFLRGLPRLAVIMKRVSPNEGRQVPYVEGEPNFYDMDLKYKLPNPSIPNQFYQHHPPVYDPSGGGTSAGQMGMSSTSAGQYYSNPNAVPAYHNPESFYQHPPPQYYGYPPPNMASAQGEQQQQGYSFPPAASVARYSNAFQPYGYPFGDMSEVAGINPMQQQQSLFYPMPHGGPPPSQYNQHGHHFHHPFGNKNDTPSDAPSSASSRPMKSEEDPPSNDKDETAL